MDINHESPLPKEMNVRASPLLSGLSVILILIGWAVVRMIAELDHASWLNSFIFVAIYTGALPATIGLLTAAFSSIRHSQIDGYIFAFVTGAFSFVPFAKGLSGGYGFFILCALQIIVCTIFLLHINKAKKVASLNNSLQSDEPPSGDTPLS
jgi:hypothetical protein